jgi:hypothetical protein
LTTVSPENMLEEPEGTIVPPSTNQQMVSPEQDANNGKYSKFVLDMLANTHKSILHPRQGAA